jgi:hypothetical protein
MNKQTEIDESKLLQQECRRSLIEFKAMRDLLSIDDDLAIMVRAGSIELGLCDNAAFAKYLDHEINEIEKCLRGEPNKYE